MCTVLLSPADNPTAVNEYILSYHILSCHIIPTEYFPVF